MNYIIIDYEFNNYAGLIQEDSNHNLFVNEFGKRFDLKVKYPEIIQIGAIKLDENFNEISRFSSFVKPLNPLSTHIKKITSIKESDLESASKFEDVLKDFINWIGKNYKICYWGNSDQTHICREIKNKKCFNFLAKRIFFSKYFNIQNKFCETLCSVNKIIIKDKSIGLKLAQKILKIEYSKQQHDALNDAELSAEILKLIVTNNGKSLEINKFKIFLSKNNILKLIKRLKNLIATEYKTITHDDLRRIS